MLKDKYVQICWQHFWVKKTLKYLRWVFLWTRTTCFRALGRLLAEGRGGSNFSPHILQLNIIDWGRLDRFIIIRKIKFLSDIFIQLRWELFYYLFFFRKALINIFRGPMDYIDFFLISLKMLKTSIN